MTESELPVGETVEAAYQYATIARLTQDVPKSNLVAGDIVLVHGNRAESQTAYTVYDEDVGDFVGVSCAVLAVLRADSPMSKQDITSWASHRAREMDLMETVVGDD